MQYKVRVGKRFTNGAINIGRGTPYGNPFVMKDKSQEERDRVCDEYEKYFQEQLEVNPKFKLAMDELVFLASTKDLLLGCYCAPLRCHGDTIRKYILQQLTDTQDTLNVWLGTNENKQFSNLHPREFIDSVTGLKFYSVEHAYQSLKSGELDTETYKKYSKNTTRKIPGILRTKKLDGWNLKLIERLMLQSFEQNEEVFRELVNTGDILITHKQDKGIWGEQFPIILTRIRERGKTIYRD